MRSSLLFIVRNETKQRRRKVYRRDHCWFRQRTGSLTIVMGFRSEERHFSCTLVYPLRHDDFLFFFSLTFTNKTERGENNGGRNERGFRKSSSSTDSPDENENGTRKNTYFDFLPSSSVQTVVYERCAENFLFFFFLLASLLRSYLFSTFFTFSFFRFSSSANTADKFVLWKISFFLFFVFLFH